MTSPALLLLILLTPGLVAGGDANCDWACSPITECQMIFSDLVRAKIARQNQNQDLLNRVISGVRNYLCDDKAESVCCPVLMGRMFGSQTPVYAINNSSVMIRSQDTSYWDNREVFFWTEETCFPWLDYNENLIEDTEKLIDVEEVFSGEVVFSLPAGLRVEESKCLSVWRDGQEIGAAHLKWPLSV